MTASFYEYLNSCIVVTNALTDIFQVVAHCPMCVLGDKISGLPVRKI